MSALRFFVIGLWLLAQPLLLFGQQWGTVEKSKDIRQLGDKTFYLHTVGDGNTYFSLAKVYGVSIEQIREANPELGNDLKRGMVILIPKIDAEKAPQENKRLTNFDAFFYHVVKPGETLFSIAKIYDVNVEDLKKINALVGNDIAPGFHLKIPEQELQKQEPVKKTITQDSPKKERYFKHIVQGKETLYSIAKHYGIGLETLKYINNFTSDNINPGQEILIPRIVKERPVQQNKDYILHQVQPKEGLFAIARKYGVNVQQIKAINPGLDENLQIGQEIKIPRVTNANGFIEHKVNERKERLSDIAREYEVSVRNLKQMNPEVPDKLRRGETVYIPVDFIDKTEPEKPQPIIGDTTTQVEEPKLLDVSKNTYREFNVALMLPLFLDDVDSLLTMDRQELLAKRGEIRSFRFLEFYEGAQLAVDSLRQLGMKVQFHVYDVTDDDVETALLLQDEELKDMDLIISLLFSRSFAMVSQFSRGYEIPLVNVLSKRRQIIYENPYVFKISPKPDAIYQRVADFVGKHFADYNTIIVRNNPYQLTNEYNLFAGLVQQKINPQVPIANTHILERIDTYMKGHEETYIDTLQTEIKKWDQRFNLEAITERPLDTNWVYNPLKTVVYSNDSLKGIMQASSLFGKNLILAMGSDEVFAIELFTKLNFVRDSIDIKVIGLPDWHGFQNLDVDYSQPFQLRVLSENFVDYSNSAAKRFVYQFNKQYHKVPEIDTYAFLGYDATFYFLSALFELGDDWMQLIPQFQIPLLENQLHFEKQGSGGYENTYWNIYRQENYSNKLEKQ